MTPPSIEQIILIIMGAIGTILVGVARKFQPTTDPVVKPPGGREADLLAYTQIGLSREDKELFNMTRQEFRTMRDSIEKTAQANEKLAEAGEAQAAAIRELVAELRESRMVTLYGRSKQ